MSREELDRRILELTDERARSVEKVIRRCDASLPTLPLRRRSGVGGPLDRTSPVDGEGNHYKTYDAALEAATIRAEDGDLTVDISTAAAAGEQNVDDSPTPDRIERPGSGNAAEEIERPSAEK